MTDITADQLSKGSRVLINPQEDRSRSILLEGVISEVLTRSNTHPHGILVSLESGEKGRVKSFAEGSPSTPTIAEPKVNILVSTPKIVIPKWLESDNPYFVREVEVLIKHLNKKYNSEDWSDVYYKEGFCGCLQEITKLIESAVESIFKMPIILILEKEELATGIYGGNRPREYNFGSSTGLISSLSYKFRDSRKKESLIDLANYIDSDLGLFFERISRLDFSAVTSLNAIRNYRNYLSHPQNNVLTEAKTRFVVDYSLVDFKEIYDLDVGLR